MTRRANLHFNAKRDKARRLFAYGHEAPGIARMLGVSSSSISLWRRADATAGVNWLALRERLRGKEPILPVVFLEQAIFELGQRTDMSDGAWADALWKLTKAWAVLVGYREQRKDRVSLAKVRATIRKERPKAPGVSNAT